MHAYIHTYIPTYRLAHTHTQMQMHRYMHTHTHKAQDTTTPSNGTEHTSMHAHYVHTYMFKSVHTEGHIKNHKDIQTSIQAYIQTNTYIHACIQIHTHVLTDIHTCMHTYVGIHTYEYMETHATRTHA